MTPWLSQRSHTSVPKHLRRPAVAQAVHADARARPPHWTSALGWLRRLLEISQIRRWLVLLDRHQQAVGADRVGLPADRDDHVALGTAADDPARTRIGAVHVFLVHRPGP